MAMSVDGKIANARRDAVKLGTKQDSKRMAEIRAKVDAVICGTGTFAAHPFPLIVHQKKLVKERIARGQRAHPISVVVSSSLQLKRNTPWHRATQYDRWAIGGRQAARASRDYLSRYGVEIYLCRGDVPKPKEVLALLYDAGCRVVLLEGGGTFNASFFEADLVDRVYLTICPLTIGGAVAPTIFDGQGLGRTFARWKLQEAKPVRNELFCVYDRVSGQWQDAKQGVSDTRDSHQLKL